MKSSRKVLIQAVVLILLVVGVGIGVFLVQQNQIFKSQAASTFSLANFKKAFESCDPEKVIKEERQKCLDTKSLKRYESQYDIDSDGWITLRDYFQLLPKFPDKAQQ